MRGTEHRIVAQGAPRIGLNFGAISVHAWITGFSCTEVLLSLKHTFGQPESPLFSYTSRMENAIARLFVKRPAQNT